MKKNIFLFTLLSFFINQISLFAQIVEGTACTATCMDPTKSSITGRMPNPNGVSPNQNLPCGNVNGTTEDNPSWWTIRPSGNSLSFQIATSNCIEGSAGCGTEVTLTLWEGDACGNVTALNCFTGKNGILTVSTTPSKVYYLQLDGVCESQCDVVLTYDKNQMLSKVDKPTLTGASKVCKGINFIYTAALPTAQGYKPDSWQWSTLGLSFGGTLLGTTGTNNATLKLSSTIADSIKKIMVCVQPVFKGKCPPTTQKQCMEVEINSLQPATCDVSICPDERPLSVNLIDCIKTANPSFNTTVSPETYVIGSAFVPGTTTTKKIDYTVTGNGCKGEVNLKIKVKSDGDNTCACVKTAGVMKTKFIITANKLTKSINVTHQNTLAAGLAFAYILHEGNADKIVNQLASNQTGVFNFDAAKMKCNKVYYVSYMVGKDLNGLPDPADKCLNVTPKGQPVAWLCPIKVPVAAAREDSQEDIALSENTQSEVAIYPNPTDDKFFIALPTLKSTPSLDLFDMQGKKVLSQNDMTQYDASHYEVQVSDLPKGIYLLKMTLDGKPAVQKIIVE
jgi:hypothetical protein